MLYLKFVKFLFKGSHRKADEKGLLLAAFYIEDFIDHK